MLVFPVTAFFDPVPVIAFVMLVALISEALIISNDDYHCKHGSIG
jgi:hypothetical protein